VRLSRAPPFLLGPRPPQGGVLQPSFLSACSHIIPLRSNELWEDEFGSLSRPGFHGMARGGFFSWGDWFPGENEGPGLPG